MKKIVIFNWKMNLPILSSWSKAIKLSTPPFLKKGRGNRIIVCPPFTHIEKVKNLLKGTKIYLGAQNVSYVPKGAYTGEISAAMLKGLGVRYSIIGHSERRYLFSESDELISKKILALAGEKITPILCVGEKRRVAFKKSWEHVKRQLEQDLPKTFHFPARLASQREAGRSLFTFRLIVAYEPVWSIGGDKPTDANHSAKMIGKIKSYLYTAYGIRPAVLYGGSVNCGNIGTFLKFKNIDGFLVGSASLKKDEISCIIKKVANK